MTQPLLYRFLQQSGVINELKVDEIAGHFNPLSLSKNEFFLKEKLVSNQYLFLEEGCMRAFATDTDGNEVTTNFFASNQVVFEVNSFFNRVASQENIQCLTKCEGWVLSYSELNMLFHSVPEFREFGRLMLVKNFAALKNRMLSVITESAEQRYTKLLAQQPQVFQHASLKNIASYLGITDSSLSRIRKEYSRK